MSQATIRAAIFAIVDGVSGTGNVYDYRRWGVKYDRVLSMFRDATAGTILGFDMEAGPFSGELSEFRQAGAQDGFRPWTFRIRMYYGAKDTDKTEPAAATLIEAVANALDKSDTLHNGQTFYSADKAVVTILELRTFAGNLVHYGQIDQVVTEYIP